MQKDPTLRLPHGGYYESFEREQTYDRTLHVNASHPTACDSNDGSADKPFKTIQAAADIATPGTRVLIHGGEYRECVRPVRGGDSAEKMIAYEAFGDGEVAIKASCVAKNFMKSEGWNRIPRGVPNYQDTASIWAVKLDPDDFRGYNPFCAVNILHDRLFIEYDKTDMTTYLNRRGMVFCDGKPLFQVPLYNQMSTIPGSYWVEANGQTVHFRLPDDSDPANHLIELTCREQCFAPDIPFLSYIKVKGLICAHAATCAPVPQRGSISCYRGHHWIIEDCVIDWANGTGIDIGNECWHHTPIKDQILGWTVIRRCEIRDVGVCGIAGMHASNVLIEDNLFSGTGWQKMELSWEAGAIKFHNCVDSVFRRNIFTKTIRADHLWLDVANQNTRITQNLFLDGIEQREAIFIECSREGINLIDHNIFWNVEGRFKPGDVPAEPGSSGWYKDQEPGIINGYAVYGEGTDRLHIVGNLIGKCRSAGYFAKTVGFRLMGASRGGTSREAKLFNNIFFDCGEAAFKLPTQHNEADGNLYLNMPSGYLRVIYPAPEVCLDLSAWQEFYGQDPNGHEGRLGIDVDTDKFTLKLRKADPAPPPFMGLPRPYHGITEWNAVPEVPFKDIAPSDFGGVSMTGDTCLPGPFASFAVDQEISIDPRILK